MLVRETSVTDRDQPLEWLLLTSLPIGKREEVELVIEYYLKRWMIELFFKVLKSGCKIESRRFEHIDRLLPALSLYLNIAWRSLYVCRVSCAYADACCEMLYTEAEWKGVWQFATKTEPPSEPPKLMELTRLMAGLGGYVNRKNSGPPGPQTVWLGLQVMYTIAECWLTFGPGSKNLCGITRFPGTDALIVIHNRPGGSEQPLPGPRGPGKLDMKSNRPGGSAQFPRHAIVSPPSGL